MTDKERDEIIAQCWTVFFRWARHGMNSDETAMVLNGLFSLLDEADPDAYQAIFEAALTKGSDFPAEIAKRYPYEDGS